MWRIMGLQSVMIRWDDDNTTHVISFNEHSITLKNLCRLIGGTQRRLVKIWRGFTLEEYMLTFTTVGPEPVTPTFVDHNTCS